MERGQHLAGELRRDLVLVLAAVAQERGEALPLGDRAVKTRSAESSMWRAREDRPARHLAAWPPRGNVEVARGLAARRVDEAQVRPVPEQADRDLALAQQPLEAGLRAGVPGAVVVGISLGGLVEVGGGGGLHDEEMVGGGLVGGAAAAASPDFAWVPAPVPPFHRRNGKRWPQRLAILGERDLQVVEELRATRGTRDVARAPAQNFLQEAREVRDARKRLPSSCACARAGCCG